MWNARQRLLAVAGGAVAAAAVVGGVAFAQTPDSGTGTPPPESGAPAPTRPAPDPGQRGDHDCPGKGGSQGTRPSQSTNAPNF